MHGSWKLVCVTPAGRRRYLRLLVPYVLACPDLDRYDLWVNTDDAGDLAFMEALADIDARIRLVRLPENPNPSSRMIGLFWPQATDADTIYIRFDDDVVWLDPHFFETLLAARLERREDFMVAPLIINNALATFVLQTFGKLHPSRRVGPDRFDAIGWRNADLPVALHRLLQKIIAADAVARLDCGRVPIAANGFSINCLCWFGADIAAFGGVLPDGEWEEPAMSCTIPLRLGRANSFETRAVAAHFAFYTQRAAMDASGLLEGYHAIAAARPELKPWRSRVETVFAEIEARYPAPPAETPRASLLARWRARRARRRHKPVTVVPGPKFWTEPTP